MTIPLIPADVNLGDFPYTPILRARLFGSAFHARASDGEWRAGVTLWLKSWDQVPAGSLPSDDVDLCRLAELGRDLKTWRKLRAMALHGWEVATDGLMYHRVVAEVVLEAWLEKLGQQLSGGAGNAKRWGLTFDPSAIQAQIVTATGMLFVLNPQSRWLRKKRLSGIPTGLQTGIPTGEQINPNGNADGTKNSPDGNPTGSPDGIASEVKRSEGNSNRDVEVTPTVEGPTKGKIANEKMAKSTTKGNGKSGQQWQDVAWVNATAKTVSKIQAPGEPFIAFRDRVYGAVQAQLAAAKAAH